jgi:hypothetical protein
MEGAVASSHADSRGVAAVVLADGRLVFGVNEDCEAWGESRRTCKPTLYWLDRDGNLAGETFRTADRVGEMTFLVAGSDSVLAGGYGKGSGGEPDVFVIAASGRDPASGPLWAHEPGAASAWGAAADGDGFVVAGETTTVEGVRAVLFRFDAAGALVQRLADWLESGSPITDSTRARAVAARPGGGFIVAGERVKGAEGSNLWIARVPGWGSAGIQTTSEDSGTGSEDRATAIAALGEGFVVAGNAGSRWWIVPCDDSGNPTTVAAAGIRETEGAISGLGIDAGGKALIAGCLDDSGTTRSPVVVRVGATGIVEWGSRPEIRIVGHPSGTGEARTAARTGDGWLVVAGTVIMNEEHQAFMSLVAAP